jgi:acyl transferase domain-containing protein
VNGPELCVASGPRDAIDQLEATLAEREVDVRRIHIDVAAHSSMLEPILEPFRARLRKAKLSPPTLPFASNLTGTWITPEEATDPEYWVRQLRQTVRFSEGMKELLADTDRVLLEVGPGRTLATLARLHPDRDPAQEVFTSLRHPDETVDDEVFLLRMLGRLWQRGVEIDWAGVHGGAKRLRVPLPTYPFEWDRHLIEPVYRLDAQAAPELLPGGGADRAGTGGESGCRGGGEAGSDASTAAAGADDPAGWLHEVRWVEASLPTDGATGDDGARPPEPARATSCSWRATMPPKRSRRRSPSSSPTERGCTGRVPAVHSGEKTTGTVCASAPRRTWSSSSKPWEQARPTAAPCPGSSTRARSTCRTTPPSWRSRPSTVSSRSGARWVAGWMARRSSWSS